MRLFKIKSFFFVLLLVFCSTSFALPPDWPKDGLIIEPDMQRTPFLRVFNDAKHSLQIAAYSLTDDALIAALAETVKRGVKVKILVTKSMFKRKDYLTGGDEETPLTKLQAIGATVRSSPDYFDQAHNKLIIVDESYGLIGTGNLHKDSFDGNTAYKRVRDVWLTVTDKPFILELMNVFEDDFEGRKTDLKKSLLVWSPDQGREPFLTLIRSAQSNIFVCQQSFEDRELADALSEAARRGVNVRLMMTPYPFTKEVDENLPNQEMVRRAGGRVGLVTHVYMHAKAMLLDVGTPLAKAWVGSTNFYPPSLEGNRELGIVTSDPAVLEKLNSVFESDWVQADFTPRVPPETGH